MRLVLASIVLAVIVLAFSCRADGHSSRRMFLQKFVEQIEHTQRLVQRGHVSCPAHGSPREVMWCIIDSSVSANLTVDHPWVPVFRLTRDGQIV